MWENKKAESNAGSNVERIFTSCKILKEKTMANVGFPQHKVLFAESNAGSNVKLTSPKHLFCAELT